MDSAILTILLPLLAGVVSSYLTYYFTLKSKRIEAIAAYKEKSYERLLLKAQGFFGESGSPEAQKEFLDEMYKSWIYCSDEVVVAANDLLMLMTMPGDKRSHDRYGHETFGNFVVAIRKDLLGKTSLDYSKFKFFRIKNLDG
jgi:hypothetical protein